MHMFNIVRVLCSMNFETFLINKMSLPIFDFCRHKDSVIVHEFWEVFSLQKKWINKNCCDEAGFIVRRIKLTIKYQMNSVRIIL